MTRATTRRLPLLLVLVGLLLLPRPTMGQPTDPDAAERPRIRDLGVRVGIFEPGRHNAITDVEGVRVGHATLMRGEDVRTGVTAVLPHPGDLFDERVPAAVHVANGFGKLVGGTQVRELGELETPVLLTCTLCVWRAADALVEWMLERPGMDDVRSINPVVGETNDGVLNDIRARPVRADDVRRALEAAAAGPVTEGSVGAGTGTRAYGWKGGIGTSSRVLPVDLGGYRVGVLVQSNHGGILTIAGAPVGRELGRFSFRGAVDDRTPEPRDDSGSPDDDSVTPDEGSIMVVVATDAPLSSRNLGRLARRAVVGLARTGSSMSNGSGDYVIAFSTAEGVRRTRGEAVRTVEDLANAEMSGLFQAVAEATEEAIYNSLLKATTVTGARGRTVEALPVTETVEILRRHGVVQEEQR